MGWKQVDDEQLKSVMEIVQTFCDNRGRRSCLGPEYWELVRSQHLSDLRRVSDWSEREFAGPVVADIALMLGKHLLKDEEELACLEELRKIRNSQTDETRVTNDQLDTLTQTLDDLISIDPAVWPGDADESRRRYGEIARLLRDLYYLPRRPYAVSIVADLATDFGDHLWQALATLDTANKEVSSLQTQIKRLRHQLAHLPKKRAMFVPPRTVKLRSAIKREALRLMATKGLGRSWRINQSITSVGLGRENSVRNALRSLADDDQLIDHYQRDGVPVSWKPVAGGNCNLWVLTELGRSYCREVLGVEPVESELLVVARKHGSVKHGVGILEARDHLEAEGYAVDDDPEVILEYGGEQWKRRVEPDLVVQMDGADWPVEVQREVSERLLGKWEKALEKTGCLIIVLFNEQKRRRQERLLRGWQQMPCDSEVRLISLEAMKNDDWAWTLIST